MTPSGERLQHLAPRRNGSALTHAQESKRVSVFSRK
jgi:hypothetical protein